VNKWVKVFLQILLWLIVLVTVFPFCWMVLLSFKTNTEILRQPLALPSTFSLSNLRSALHQVDYLRMYGNTFVVALVSVIGGMFLTFMSSFALAKMEFKSERTRSFIHIFLLSGIAIPGFILLYPIYRISVAMKIRDTLLGLILPYAATTLSFNTLLMVPFLHQLPKEIDEAAVIDGCNIWSLMFRVIAPIAKPILTTIFVFNIIYVFNEYPLASVLLDSAKNFTLALSVYQFKGLYSLNYGAMISGSLLIVIPELIFYGFFRRYVIEGMTAGAVKG
jgi:raffinose/stachyose/melibiose transport system permease protein